jgi:hypothetical protein
MRSGCDSPAVVIATRRRCFDTPTTKIRRHCLTSLINSEFTIGPVLALKLDEALGSSGESRMKGFKVVNRKFSATTWRLLATIFCLLAQAKAQEKKASIVFMLMDTLGYGEPGVYRGGILRGVPTPRIDTLASEGMPFSTLMSSLNVAQRIYIRRLG